MKPAGQNSSERLLAHLNSRTLPVDAPSFYGEWATIEVQPDLFSPQTFCVGVAVATGAAGDLRFQLITDPKKFECVYGSSSVVSELLREAEETLARVARDRVSLDAMAFGTQNVRLGRRMPAAGSNVEATLDRLFREVVVMEPATKERKSGFESLDTKEVRDLVNAELKRMAGLAHAQLIVGADQCLISDGNQTHVLDVTYRSGRGVGNLVSAVVKTPDTADLNVLRGADNLETFARLRGVTDRALFIMSAKREALGASDFKRVSDRIKEHEWRLEKRGVRVVTMDEPAAIALDVLEWAGIEPVK